jgi:hypothetical protein
MQSDELATMTAPTKPIDLDDVLDSSFLDSDRDNAHVLSSPCNDDDSRKHLKSLNRWDLISVGAFRQTRESAGSMSDSPSASWLGERSDGFEGIMKTNPLTTMLWHNKASNAKAGKRNINVAISPVLLPTRDGDRTPTSAGQTPQSNTNANKSHKTRKEIRREKQVRRKSTGSVPQQLHHNHKHHNQYHHHPHHPNSKTRSSSSLQRTNFIGPISGVPALNL